MVAAVVFALSLLITAAVAATGIVAIVARWHSTTLTAEWSAWRYRRWVRRHCPHPEHRLLPVHGEARRHLRASWVCDECGARLREV